MNVQIHRVMVLVAVSKPQSPGQIERAVDEALSSGKFTAALSGESNADARHVGVTEVEIPNQPTATGKTQQEFHEAMDQWTDAHWDSILIDRDNNGELTRESKR
jgi:hypothetical protein